MQSFLLMTARFSLAAWVGAASLFVVTSIQEVRSPQFDSVTKSALALLRFPTYYLFGFGFVTVALLSGLIAVRHPSIGRMRMVFCLALMMAAFVTMIADYVAVFTPLKSMISQMAEARPANFQTYHNASMYINSAHIGLCLVAALVLGWPGSRK